MAMPGAGIFGRNHFAGLGGRMYRTLQSLDQQLSSCHGRWVECSHRVLRPYGPWYEFRGAERVRVRRHTKPQRGNEWNTWHSTARPKLWLRVAIPCFIGPKNRLPLRRRRSAWYWETFSIPIPRHSEFPQELMKDGQSIRKSWWTHNFWNTLASHGVSR